MSSNLLNAPQEFLRLFTEGKNAARLGRKQEAHDLFRRAIEVDPYHEQVWLWLASVVETDEDRRVCFENVLELDPENPTARRQLQKLEYRATESAQKLSPERARQPHRAPIVQPQPKPQTRKRARRRSLPRLLLALIVVIVVVVVLVLVIT